MTHTPPPLFSFIVFAQDDPSALQDSLQSIIHSAGPPGVVNGAGFSSEILVMLEAKPIHLLGPEIQACTDSGATPIVHNPSTGMNIVEQAAHIAKGELVWFLNAGDLLHPHALYRLLDDISKQPYHIGAYGRMTRLNAEGQLVDGRRWPKCEDAPSGDVLHDLLKGKEFLKLGNVCLRRSALKKVRLPISLQHGRDWVLFCRLALHGHFIFIGDYMAVSCRRNHFSASDTRFGIPPADHILHQVFSDKQFIRAIGEQTLRTYREQWNTIDHPTALPEPKDAYAAMDMLQKQFGRALLAGSGPLQATPLQAIPPRAPDKRIRILHVIKYFYAGGCERLLRNILENTDTSRFEHVVLSLSDQKERIEDITETLGVPYYTVDMPDSPHLAHHLHAFLMMERIAPDIVKTWLHLPNISGGLLGFLLKKPVVWGIHNYFSARAGSPLEYGLSHHIPYRIICCSHPIRDAAVEHGYAPHLLSVIENGTDTARFRHSPEGRKRLRTEWDIDDGTLLIGMAAEYQPFKRHHYFLRAAKELVNRHGNVRFLLCGKQVCRENRHLMQTIKALGLEPYVLPVGVRDDMADVYSTLDIHTLCPENEPFGLAVIESMACETYPVTMSVIPGIVQGVGISLPFSEDPCVLADAWAEALGMPPEERKRYAQKGRERIVRKYPIRETVRKYDAMFEDVYRTARPYTGGAT